MEQLSTNSIIFVALSIIIVAGLMSLYKSLYYLITKKSTNKYVNQIIAWIFSYCATLLCHFCIGIPADFRQTFVYVFAVYVIQMRIDLDCIKKIIDLKLKEKGV